MSDQPHPVGVRLLPWKISPWLIDAALISVAILGFVRRPFSEDGSFEAIDVIALIMGILVLLGRRRFPLPALAAGLVTSIVIVVGVDRPSMILPVTLVALFTVGLQCNRQIALVAGAVTTVAFGILIIVLLRHGDLDGAGLASIAWPAFAVAAGAAVRTSRENMAATQERAERAEQSRELEAQRRVVEERLRIARDVHDLVAHHIAVINVQAGVADHLMQTDPAAAGQALEVVREAASTVVDQLGELLSVLRTPDDVADPTAPTPDLDAIEDLISSFASSGLQVQRETSGARRPLSGSAELAAYRVVQEALTNAHKYGDGSAVVALRYSDSGLEIAVTNNVTDSDVLGSGFGIIGMRERVEAVGGTLDADGVAQRFALTAHIPATTET